MFKKIVSIILCVAMLAAFALVASSCGNSKDDFKLGVILLHDEDSTYDLNFINAVKEAQKQLGLKNSQVIFKRGIPEGNECYEAACDLVDEGCKVIFADSFGHEPYMIKAAEKFPEVQFCHATGTKAHTQGLKNYHNAFASIYEGRFLAGVAAGMKLNEMIEAGTITADKAKMGYVGAFTYAEVISGLTSFYLGAKYVCPSVTMDVQFTGEWYDENKEKAAALALMDAGCVLISQHADSMGAPSACEDRNVPNVSYNGSTEAACPNTFIVSSKIDWTPYVKYICESTMNGTEIKADWCGDTKTGSVKLSDLGKKAAAAGTQAKIDEVKALLESGKLHVFDTATFTVDGKTLTTYLADVDDMGDYVKETEAIKDGYFHESEYRSAPYFDLRIDGITFLNEKY
ncbi:MAG TPA: BMP family ABC transporter substrate-binding protein [Clostridiales bacterium]|nr:BMP family ABC transporter substrate-binding protein [Candidatus Apopatosoma intestinale]